MDAAATVAGGQDNSGRHNSLTQSVLCRVAPGDRGGLRDLATEQTVAAAFGSGDRTLAMIDRFPNSILPWRIASVASDMWAGCSPPLLSCLVKVVPGYGTLLSLGQVNLLVTSSARVSGGAGNLVRLCNLGTARPKVSRRAASHDTLDRAFFTTPREKEKRVGAVLLHKWR